MFVSCFDQLHKVTVRPKSKKSNELMSLCYRIVSVYKANYNKLYFDQINLPKIKIEMKNSKVKGVKINVACLKHKRVSVARVITIRNLFFSK